MEKNFYLGIDVSNGYADFIILDKNKKVVEDGFQLDDTFEGHNQLFKFLCGFFASNPDAHLYAAVESTGGYENNWFSCLHKHQSEFNISVSRLNPFGVNYNSKATLERIITDKQSAKNIAGYLISHPEKVNYQKEDYFAAQRRQWTFIKMLTKQKVQLLNQLESLLYSANTEILYYCKDGVRMWTLKLLKQYPTAKHLARAKVSTVSKIPYVSKARAEKLVNTQNSLRNAKK
jgi:transposase